ncbi:MAG: universal stress protein [Beijerinckiaceae bacterium]
MTIRTVSLAIIVEDEISSTSATAYAVGLADKERAHLSCLIVVPILDLPSARLLPLVHALVDQVNFERRARAEAAQERVTTACRIAGVPLSCQIVQERYVEARATLIAAVRASDLVVMARSTGLLSSEGGLGEGVLFESGRPVICVPPDWTAEPKFEHIVIAWDGGARAARAVGDALVFLERASDVEVVSVTGEDDRRLAGAELSEHLARHCRSVKLTDLPIANDDAGWTLRDHLNIVKPDLLVMGAFAHSRLLQFMVGGVTNLMINSAERPVLYAY